MKNCETTVRSSFGGAPPRIGNVQFPQPFFKDFRCIGGASQRLLTMSVLRRDLGRSKLSCFVGSVEMQHNREHTSLKHRRESYRQVLDGLAVLSAPPLVGVGSLSHERLSVTPSKHFSLESTSSKPCRRRVRQRVGGLAVEPRKVAPKGAEGQQQSARARAAIRGVT